MYRTLIIKLVTTCVVLGGMGSVTLAANRHSNDFQFKYEGDLLPSDVGITPRWERSIAGGVINETFYNSVADGILTIDTVKGPSATEGAIYFLPGETCNLLPAEDGFYTNGDPTNPWDVDFGTGYTVEVKFRMDSMQIPDDPCFPDGKFAFWLYAREGLHGQASSCQVFTNKIILTNSEPNEVLYAGDLTDKFYTLRIVRNPGFVEDVTEVYDFYLDGVLIAENRVGVGVAYNQDDFQFGDGAGGSGGTDIKVEIDYVRIDLTGAFAPPYLITDINEDTFTDVRDFAALAHNWNLYSDPDMAGYVDCADPNNADICQE